MLALPKFSVTANDAITVLDSTNRTIIVDVNKNMLLQSDQLVLLTLMAILVIRAPDTIAIPLAVLTTATSLAAHLDLLTISGANYFAP